MRRCIWCVVAGKGGKTCLSSCGRMGRRLCGVRCDDWEDEEGDDERWSLGEKKP